MTEVNAFVDLQVNGYAGVDFNDDDWTASDLQVMCQKLRDDGVGSILATLITAPQDKLSQRLARLAAVRQSDPVVAECIAGFHVEGPFVNPAQGFIGAHDPSAACQADVECVERLMEAAGGLIRIWTLAPECDPGFAVTRALSDMGVVVSAGHCDPSLDQLKGAMDAGLKMFTHLGNGCPAMLPRHDNVIQRVLSLGDDLWISFIADGVHVPFEVLGNYLKVVGMDRAVVVTDAISAAGLGPGTYALGGRPVEVGADLAGRYPGENDHLAGSAITMARSAENLSRCLNLDERSVKLLTSTNPRCILGME